MKPFSKKQVIKDNQELTSSLNRCVQANIELKLLHENMFNDIDKANKKYQAWIDFINDKYPELWDEFKQYNKGNT